MNSSQGRRIGDHNNTGSIDVLSNQLSNICDKADKWLKETERALKVITEIRRDAMIMKEAIKWFKDTRKDMENTSKNGNISEELSAAGVDHLRSLCSNVETSMQTMALQFADKDNRFREFFQLDKKDFKLNQTLISDFYKEQESIFFGQHEIRDSILTMIEVAAEISEARNHHHHRSRQDDDHSWLDKPFASSSTQAAVGRTLRSNASSSSNKMTTNDEVITVDGDDDAPAHKKSRNSSTTNNQHHLSAAVSSTRPSKAMQRVDAMDETDNGVEELSSEYVEKGMIFIEETIELEQSEDESKNGKGESGTRRRGSSLRVQDDKDAEDSDATVEESSAYAALMDLGSAYPRRETRTQKRLRNDKSTDNNASYEQDADSNTKTVARNSLSVETGPPDSAGVDRSDVQEEAQPRKPPKRPSGANAKMNPVVDLSEDAM